MQSDDLWINILGVLSRQISEQNFYTWIEPVKFLDTQDQSIRLAVPSRFMKNIIEERYLELIREAAGALGQPDIQIELHIDKELGQELRREEPLAQHHQVQEREAAPVVDNDSLQDPVPSAPVQTELTTQYTFENFVVGGSNQFAHAAALAVAQHPGTTYNPLFIYGGTGLGKTHLIQAIGNAMLKTNPRASIVYIDSEQFTNQMVNAIRAGKVEAFRSKFRYVDALIIDDIQFIAGKNSTQEEFFHTFNTLYSSKKQIILSSDKFPREIPKLEDRLRSRFEWGLIADIQPPDLETKLAILKKKADAEDIYLPNEVALFIAKAIKNNIRELEGALIRVSAYSKLTGVELSIDVIKSILKDIVRDTERVISCDDIQNQVATRYGIRTQDLKSKSRSAELTLARHLAMYFCRKLTNMSLPQIGREFGGRDHSTVVHAIKTIDKKRLENEQFNLEIESIENQILS